MKILILRIILRKLQNSKKNSENKKIRRIRMFVNTAPDTGLCPDGRHGSERASVEYGHAK